VSLLKSTVGLAADPPIRNDVLGMDVVASGSDGCKVPMLAGLAVVGAAARRRALSGSRAAT
jgi:hypothetical protein